MGERRVCKVLGFVILRIFFLFVIKVKVLKDIVV